jgi:hypothetical protein
MFLEACLASIVIILVLMAYQYFVTPEWFQVNVMKLQWQREMAAYEGNKDHDRAEERKRMGMGVGGRLYHRLRDFLTYIRSFTTGRPR